MRKFIEKTIAGQDAAFWVDVRLDDASFDHEFGVEQRVEVEFDVEECEGCTPAHAEQWCWEHRSELVAWALKEGEDDLCNVPSEF